MQTLAQALGCTPNFYYLSDNDIELPSVWIKEHNPHGGTASKLQWVQYLLEPTGDQSGNYGELPKSAVIHHQRKLWWAREYIHIFRNYRIGNKIATMAINDPIHAIVKATNKSLLPVTETLYQLVSLPVHGLHGWIVYNDRLDQHAITLGHLDLPKTPLSVLELTCNVAPGDVTCQYSAMVKGILANAKVGECTRTVPYKPLGQYIPVTPVEGELYYKMS